MNDDDTLIKFKAEVLDNGPEACLPCNLSNDWLEYLSMQLEDIFEGDEDARLTEALAVVIHILPGKNGGKKEVSLSEEELINHFEKYRVELSLEEVCRKTEFTYIPATLETIFENRKVEIGRD